MSTHLSGLSENSVLGNSPVARPSSSSNNNQRGDFSNALGSADNAQKKANSGVNQSKTDNKPESASGKKLPANGKQNASGSTEGDGEKITEAPTSGLIVTPDEQELDANVLFADASQSIKFNLVGGESEYGANKSNLLSKLELSLEKLLAGVSDQTSTKVIDGDALNIGEKNDERMLGRSNLLNGMSTLAKAELAVPVRVGSPEWGESMAGKISILVNQRISSARIQLTPPELGPIEIRINLNNEQASVQFISHSAQVRDSLEQTIPKLREMLESQGFSLSESHVGAELNQQDDQQSKQASVPQTKLDETEPSLNDSPIRVASMGIVDHYV